MATYTNVSGQYTFGDLQTALADAGTSLLSSSSDRVVYDLGPLGLLIVSGTDLVASVSGLTGGMLDGVSHTSADQLIVHQEIDGISLPAIWQYAASNTLLPADLLYRATAAGDTFNGASIADTGVIGGAGDDTIYGGAGDDVIDGDGLVAWGLMGSDTIYGGAGNDTIHSDDRADFVHGGTGDDIIHAGGGSDEVYGEDGDDIVYGDDERIFVYMPGYDKLFGGDGRDKIYGGNLADELHGGAGDDVVDGGESDDKVWGDGGADTLIGGTGHDSYHVDGADTIVEFADEGLDTVYTSVDYILGQNVEWLSAEDVSSTAPLKLTGNSDANKITGNNGNNILNSGFDRYADWLYGGLGDDTFIVGEEDHIVDNGGFDHVFTNSTRILDGGEIENLTLTGTANIDGTGNRLLNVITGNSGNNVLSGGFDSFADRLVGGKGDDTYSIGKFSNDVIVELPAEGIDTILAFREFDLSGYADIENLTLAGAFHGNGTGNALANVITGNTYDNVLDGGGEDGVADTLIGGWGSDTYVLGSGSDRVVELADGSGSDLVTTTISRSLMRDDLGYIEDLTLLDGALNGMGNGRANTITGNAGDNVLDGGGGKDRLAGGLGNDTYVVDDMADVIVEQAGQGKADRVKAAASYVLAAGLDIEFLETADATATTNIDLTGNKLFQNVTGNAGDNLIDGGIGADVMRGLSGDDGYTIDSSGDRVIEVAGGGDDFVMTSVFSIDLANFTHIEGVVLTGQSVIHAKGTAQDNLLVGETNAAANKLTGLAGDDVYFVGTGDIIVEAGGVSSGADTVCSTSLSLNLAQFANVENIALFGSAALSAKGNARNNEIAGNDAANVLTGGAGADTFVFIAQLGNGNVDKITDFNVQADTIGLQSTDGGPFGALAVGTLTAAAFASGAGLNHALDASDRIIYDTRSASLYYDSDGLGGAAAVKFAVLASTVKPKLTHLDFLIE